MEIISLSKGEMNGAFSQTCRDALHYELELGDRAEWYATVVEAVTASSLTFTLALDHAPDLHQLIPGLRASLPWSGTLTEKAISEEVVVLELETELVLGYKARPLEWVSNDAP